MSLRNKASFFILCFDTCMNIVSFQTSSMVNKKMLGVTKEDMVDKQRIDRHKKKLNVPFL